MRSPYFAGDAIATTRLCGRLVVNPLLIGSSEVALTEAQRGQPELHIILGCVPRDFGR